MRRTVLALSLCLFVCIALTPPAGGHVFQVTDVQLVLLEGKYQADVTVDVDALALGVDPAIDSSEIVAALEALTGDELEEAKQRARETMARRSRLRFDGVKQRPTVSFPGPDLDDPIPSILGTTARLTGLIPADARELTFGVSRTFGEVRLRIVDLNTGIEAMHLLTLGENSPSFFLDGAQPVENRWNVARRYVALGFTHILPLGLDHILFVAGLFLLSARLRPLLWQVSAFTLAHTITLGLAMAGWVSLPGRLVETTIALSIAYVAIENLATDKLHPWRPVLVFAFGLLHGLGFAGVLHALGLPAGRYASALVAFNIGVELGQLAVLAALALAVGWFRAHKRYRSFVVVPASVLIALVGLYWAVTRALGVG